MYVGGRVKKSTKMAAIRKLSQNNQKSNQHTVGINVNNHTNMKFL